MRSCCCNPCRIAAHRWCSLIRSTATRSTGSSTETKARVRKAARPAAADDRRLHRHLLPRNCARTTAEWLSDDGPTLLALRGRISLSAIYPIVDLVAWNSQHFGKGYRTRRRGDYLLILQKSPLAAKAPWRDHAIRDRWTEKVDRKLHPHIKPIGLIRKLIGAVTRPGDLVVDPAAGSFVVMHAAHQLGRDFVGCDLAYYPINRITTER